ncbi:hypothetical protein ACFE04_003538 [Oxalis oulophora]
MVLGLHEVEDCFMESEFMYEYEGCWFQANKGIEALLWMEDHFKTKPTNVFLMTRPKACTTCLKALQFSNKLIKKLRGSEHDIHLEQVFDMFSTCSYWDNLLGYCKANLESPNKVLFLRYEEMLENDLGHVRKLACTILGLLFVREGNFNLN